MTEKRRFLDVWLVESNTVYREVPFNVVTDWVQQSRLLPDDMLRPSGTAQWYKVGSSPEFSPYIPRSEPYRVEDRAEAEEPVELDFAWKRKPEDEDDDVDMIPLIDISLVLLIFFIMTTTGAPPPTSPTRPALQRPRHQRHQYAVDRHQERGRRPCLLHRQRQQSAGQPLTAHCHHARSPQTPRRTGGRGARPGGRDHPGGEERRVGSGADLTLALGQRTQPRDKHGINKKYIAVSEKSEP